jgi:hypothetical protein
MLRRVFGPKRETVIREWRNVRGVERHVLCCSPDVIWVDHMKEDESAEVVHLPLKMG